MAKKQVKIDTEEVLTGLFSVFEDPSLSDRERLSVFRAAATELDRGGADNVSRAVVWNAVGMLVYRTGGGTKQEEIAFGYALNLLRGCREETGDILPTVLANLGECMQRSGRWQKADRLFDEACRHYYDSGNYGRYSQTAGSRAECLYRTKGAGAALSFLNVEIRRLKRKSGSDQVRASSALLTARAVINGTEGKKRAALRDFSSVIRLCRRSGMYDVLMTAYAGRSVANESAGRLGSACIDAEVAVEMTRLAFEQPDNVYRLEMFDRCHVLGRIEEKLGRMERAAEHYLYAANFASCCDGELAGSPQTAEKEAMSLYRAAYCHSRCAGMLYYESLLEYGRALAILEALPEGTAEEQKRSILLARADIYEAFGEDGLALADLAASRA